MWVIYFDDERPFPSIQINTINSNHVRLNMAQDIFLSLSAAVLQWTQCCHWWMEAILQQHLRLKWCSYSLHIILFI